MDQAERENLIRECADRVLNAVRSEYTVMPRYGYHQPLDYQIESETPKFDPPVTVVDVKLPLPPITQRMGYPADNDEYLNWGKYDHDQVMNCITKYSDLAENKTILDFGCSSGRVLRHFERERIDYGWKLVGCDVQAMPIEWLQQNFPKSMQVFTSNVLPHLPLEDNSVDVIYGFSVFTHIKYQWDAWILELKRLLKPGGLLIQTIHAEEAWNFYRTHKDEAWVNNALPKRLLNAGEMDTDFFMYGDIGVSQAFWKREAIFKYWGRLIEVVDVLPPPEKYSFQSWVICRK